MVIWKSGPDQGVPDVKYCPDGACPSGEFPSGTRAGRQFTDAIIQAVNAQDQTDRVPAVGKTRTAQDTDAHQSEASDFDRHRIPVRCLLTVDFSAAGISARPMNFLAGAWSGRQLTGRLRISKV